MTGDRCMLRSHWNSEQLRGLLAVILLCSAHGHRQHVEQRRLALPSHSAAGGVKVFYHLTAINNYRSVSHVVSHVLIAEPAVLLHDLAYYARREVVLDHMSKLHLSGLYQRADNVYCFILGEDDAVEQARQLLAAFGRKFVVAATSRDVEQYERFTLLRMRAYIAPSDKVSCLHALADASVLHALAGLLNLTYTLACRCSTFTPRESRATCPSMSTGGA